MKLYLNKKLESIPLINQLLTMMKEFYSSDLLKGLPVSIDELTEVRHYYDPVREFVDLYNSNQGLGLDEARIQYIVNAVYNAKGAPRVLDILAETLEWDIEYTYEFPNFINLTIESLTAVDLQGFIVKFENMLYYVIYYNQLKLKIKELIIPLLMDALVTLNVSIIGFKTHNYRSNNIALW